MTHTQEQFKIRREQNAWRILQLMLQYRGEKIAWKRHVFVRELQITDTEAQSSLTWLLKEELVDHQGEKWYTRKGAQNIYDSHTRSKEFRTGQSAHSFRVEALTGMDSRGNRSRLSRAVLPAPGLEPHQSHDREYIDSCTRAERIRQAALEVGLSVEETEKKMMTGEVHICKGLEGMVDHWGIFHAHGSKKGQHWQALCVKCRRLQRKTGPKWPK